MRRRVVEIEQACRTLESGVAADALPPQSKMVQFRRRRKKRCGLAVTELVKGEGTLNLAELNIQHPTSTIQHPTWRWGAWGVGRGNFEPRTSNFEHPTSNMGMGAALSEKSPYLHGRPGRNGRELTLAASSQPSKQPATVGEQACRAEGGKCECGGFGDGGDFQDQIRRRALVGGCEYVSVIWLAQVASQGDLT